MLVAAEILLATSGLGYVIDQSRSMLRVDQVMAGIATIGIMGYLVETYVFTVMERITIARWGIRSDQKR
jgi:ABC-type nitrate/sulfonate/bicarbonate transport system permease component